MEVSRESFLENFLSTVPGASPTCCDGRTDGGGWWWMVVGGWWWMVDGGGWMGSKKVL